MTTSPWTCTRATIVLLAAAWLAGPAARAENFTTNIIDGIAVNTNVTFTVGNTGVSNVLEILNGGSLSVIGQDSLIGNSPGANYNSALVTGGSAWNTGGFLDIGEAGAGNQLTIAAGAAVQSGAGVIGYSSSADNNSVLVTGGLSLWSVTNSLTVGWYGSGNTLTVTSGGSLSSQDAYVGETGGSADNLVLVSGNNSSWISADRIMIGDQGVRNQLIIAGGGAVSCSRGTVGAQFDANFNSVLVTNAGSSWTCTEYLRVGSDGNDNSLVISTGAVVNTPSLVVGVGSGVTGNSVTLAGGSLFVTNDTHDAVLRIRSGTLIVAGGTLRYDDLQVNSNGRVRYQRVPLVVNNTVARIQDGTFEIDDKVTVAGLADTTGSLEVTGGQLIVSNNVIGIGNDGTTLGGGGVGSMSIENAEVTATAVVLGSADGGQGSLSILPGAILKLRPSDNPEADTPCRLAGNNVLLDGGTIDGPNAALVLGENHPSTLTISNGVAVFQDGYIGFNDTGTYSQAGGILTVLSNLLVGDCANNATGTATLDAGELYVTNAAHNAAMIVRKGSFTMTGGSLTVDKLILTNTCGGTFNHSGGTLTYGELILAPTGDADGDGLTNSWEQAHGLDPLSTAGVNGATGDADGDGMTNLQEFQAGTNPTLNLTGIAREGDSVRVSWSMGGSKDSVLQASPDLANASFTNLFTVSAGSASATNYLDVGAVTNAPARFYRVRLVP